MPNVTLHLLLAEETLEHWFLGSSSPFAIQTPSHLEAFRQGCIAPDLGYFPGGERHLSDLAHGTRSGDLARTLLETARHPIERAFAWGWVTHVVADRLVHPIIGRAVGELVTGDRTRYVPGDEDTPGHVRVETGLDAWFAWHHPWLRRLRFRPLFDRQGIGFLSRAFGSIRAGDGDPDRILASYRTMLPLAGRAVASIGWLGGTGDQPRRTPCWMGPLARWAGRRRLPGSVALGFLAPAAPAPWLLEEVLEVVRRFPAEVERVRQDPAPALPNVHLDSLELEVYARVGGGSAPQLVLTGNNL